MLQKRTKIIATVGPSLMKPADFAKAIKLGVNVFRLNLSHGNRGGWKDSIASIRAAEEKTSIPVAIMLDLAGTKLRIKVAGGNAMINKGDKIMIAFGSESYDKPSRSASKNAHNTSYTAGSRPTGRSGGYMVSGNKTGGAFGGGSFSIPDPAVLKMISAGDRMLIDDGKIQLKVESKGANHVIARVNNGSLIENNKGLNLPDAETFPGGLTEKDRSDIVFGIKHGVDIFALSFVTGPEDAKVACDLMRELGSTCPVYAKIEKPQAIKKMGEIIDAFDGVMIARGDLAVEMPYDKVPMLQKKILELCYAKSKPAIVATQILETMIKQDTPTRAEISDIANAIYDRADVLMLSGETAVGKYPMKAIETMVKVVNETEHYVKDPDPSVKRTHSTSHALAHTVNSLVKNTGAKGIAVWTESGRTARLLSKEYPSVPIFAYTDNRKVLRQMSILRGVQGRFLKFSKVTEKMILEVDNDLSSSKLLRKGDIAILVGGMPIASRQPANFIKYHVVGNIRGTDQ